MQSEVIEKVIADLTDKIKDHPLDVKSLEYSSKLTIDVLLCYLQVALALAFILVKLFTRRRLSCQIELIGQVCGRWLAD